MKINVDKASLKENEVDIESFLSKISTGKAILFTGAGFSIGTKNINGKSPPLADQLAKNICQLGKFDEDKDLRFVADYFLENNDSAELINFLKNNYSLQEVSQTHINICKVNWRRCYTTNYDKSIEIASAKNGKNVECIDLKFPTQEYYKRDKLCIHLNGSIDSLTEDSLQDSFKLSTSSYISAESFLNGPWYSHFKRDLDRCSSIVFVGYSMYDIDIQKILFENESLKEKTYFITENNPDIKQKFTLSKFGNILPIGVNGLAKLITDNDILFDYDDYEYSLQSLSLYKVSDNLQQLRDLNIEKMFMYGDIEKTFVDGAVIGGLDKPYLIIREDLKKALDFIKKNKNIIIFGDLGNGKSMFLNELKPYLSVNSIDVYEITDKDADYIQDIDELAKSNKATVIILDDYVYCIDIFEHYASTIPRNITIIASARTPDHEKLRPKLKEINFSFCEVNIDLLTNDEASEFVNIIDNIGMWGDKAGLPRDKKIQFLQDKNDKQISSTLLTLFDSPQIKDKISGLLRNLFINSNYKDTIFAISLLNYLNLPTYSSLVSDVSRNDEIYGSKLIHNESFKLLFKLSGNKVLAKSSLFCLALIKNNFSASYITSQFQKIAQKFNVVNKNHEQEKVFKSMLKFSFVEGFLPDTNKKSNLKDYYENLKTLVPWLKTDPHYWLQYGMAVITFKDYTKAQQFFDTAYSLAANKAHYHTNNIDTQQARLFLLLAIDDTSHLKSYDYFEKANRLLSKLDNDVYKFRQVEKYRDFFDSCYGNLSKKNKTNFEQACKKLISDIKKAEDFNEIEANQHKPIAKAKENLLFILNSIATSQLKITGSSYVD